MSSSNTENFSVVKSTQCLVPHLLGLSRNSVILIDIDDTIITPCSKTFRAPPHNQLIESIKKDKASHANYHDIISNWRLQRKVMLLDENWPKMLNSLKEKFQTYAITKMDTGKVGNIISMEQWRYNELKSLGIEFSDHNEIQNAASDHGNGGPIFYNGIFFAGTKSKSQTLELYKNFLKTDTIVFIDDRVEYLQDIQAFCSDNSIKFIGLLFNGLEKFQDIPDPALAKFQSDHLISNAKWLEDDEAYELMNLEKNQ